MTENDQFALAVDTIKIEEVENPTVKTENNDNESLAVIEDRSGKERANDDDILSMTQSELIELYKNSNSYICDLETRLTNLEAELLSVKNTADFQKHRDPSYREKILLRKLALKEQEIQDFAAQLNELKAAQIPSLATLKSTLLDPAVNIIVQKLKNELSSTKASLEETRNELNAWKFTPDSNTGKRLMAKCRLLHQENEELGKMISSGRVAKLEGELALQKNFSEEVKKSQFELDELLQDLDEDVEGMQGTIYYLQQELKKSKDKIADLETKNQELRILVDSGSDKNKSINNIIDVKLESAEKGPGQNVSNNDDDSSNDSSCLILKVNPDEEYESMLDVNDESVKSSICETDRKTKRPSEDTFENISSKKQKRSGSQDQDIQD